MADLFGYQTASIKSPITADKCTIQWGGVVAGAVQVSISYSQQINRRRTIGNKDTVIWASQPSGQATIQRLITTAGLDTGGTGWNACNPATITFNLAGCGTGGGSLRANGAVVSEYSIQAEAESLTVMDNVVIDFLQLDQG
jgi:hypothetical protein